jgi:elongation factor 1-beta
VPSQADTQVFEALGGAPKEAHAVRWYNHIKSFGPGMKQFAKASAGFSLGGGAAAAAAADDEDDVDLFGSSEEEDEETKKEKERITEERLKAYNEKKSKKAKVIAKTSVLLDVKVSPCLS